MKDKLKPERKRRKKSKNDNSPNSAVDITDQMMYEYGGFDDIELLDLFETGSTTASLEEAQSELEKKPKAAPQFSKEHEQLIDSLQAFYEQSEIDQQGQAIIPVVSDADMQKLIGYDQQIEQQSQILMVRFAKSLKEGNDELARQIMRDPNFDFTIPDGHGNTALHYTTRLNKPEFTQELVKRKANTDVPNNLGNTPLHYSMGFGLEENTRILLKAGAKRDIQNNKGKKPLDVVSKSFKQKAMIKGSFLQSAEKGDIQKLEKIIEVSSKNSSVKGTDWKKWKDKDGNTALHKTVGSGKYEAAKALLDKGADIEAQNNDGKKPAELAPQQYKWNFYALINN